MVTVKSRDRIGALHASEKQNLIPYRLLLGGTLVSILGSLAFGILDKRPMGLAVAGLAVVLAATFFIQLFRWHPEPTARRQLVVAIVVKFALGAAGAVVVDLAIAEYFLRRGECPIWLVCAQEAGRIVRAR